MQNQPHASHARARTRGRRRTVRQALGRLPTRFRFAVATSDDATPVLRRAIVDLVERNMADWCVARGALLGER